MVAMTYDEIRKSVTAVTGILELEDMIGIFPTTLLMEKVITWYGFYSFELSPSQLFASVRDTFFDLSFRKSSEYVDDGVVVYLQDHPIYIPRMTQYIKGSYPVVLHLMCPPEAIEALVYNNISWKSLGGYQGGTETWPFSFADFQNIYDDEDRILGKWVPDDLADYFPYVDTVPEEEWFR